MIKEGQKVKECEACNTVAFMDCEYRPQIGYFVICRSCGGKGGGYISPEVAFENWNNCEVNE